MGIYLSSGGAKVVSPPSWLCDPTPPMPMPVSLQVGIIAIKSSLRVDPAKRLGSGSIYQTGPDLIIIVEMTMATEEHGNTKLMWSLFF
jgi:hypothetical protein